MRVLVAGASGAIGRPLVALLRDAGHEVSALARSPERARTLEAGGLQAHVCDVFDAASVHAAVAAAAPEVLVHQLTAIPSAVNLRKFESEFAPTARLREEATPHLMAAAQATGVRRVVCQSISCVTAPEGPPVHDEDARLYVNAPRAWATMIRAVQAMEHSVLHTEGVSGVVLRYGFFYGPGTAYAPGASNAEEVRKRRFPLAGTGAGISSFVHIDDAAAATVTALEGGTAGVYNVCDDEPAALHEWLPVMATALGAKPPRRVPALIPRLLLGPHIVHFATTLRGNSNARFKQGFAFKPAHPTWRTGFGEVFG